MGAAIGDIVTQMEVDGVKCIAGFSGLDREIKGFSVLDTPEILMWLKGGELLVSAGYVLKNNPNMMNTLIYDLKKKGSVGLGIKVKRYFDKIPRELIADGNQYDFPIFELPYSIRFSDLSKTIYKNLFSFEINQLQQRNLIYQEVLDTVLSDDVSTEHLLYRIGCHIKNPLVLTDENMNLRSFDIPAENHVRLQNYFDLNERNLIFENAAVRQVLTHYRNTGFKAFAIERYHRMEKVDAVVFSITSDKKLKGFLIVAETISALDTEKYGIMERIIYMIAIHLLKTELSSKGIGTIGNSFLNNVLLSSQATEKTVKYFCNLYKFNTSLKRICLNFNIPSLRHMPYAKRKGCMDSIVSTITFVVNASGTHHYDFQFEDGFFTFLFFEDRVEKSCAFDVAKEIAGEVIERVDVNQAKVTVGISDCYTSIMKISLAFKQSIDIEKIGEQMILDSKVFSIDTLRAYYIMFSTMNAYQLQEIYRDTIEELVRYDMENNGDYVETLKMYILNKFNMSKTALALHIHRNTLMYRMEKIHEILAIDLDNYDSILGIQLGLYAKALLQDKWD